MKKIVVLSTLLASSLLLSSCSIDPMASGVAVMAQDVTTATNDRRSPGELIDDKNIYKKLNNIVKNDSMLENSHITFLVYGKSAAILGEAPTAEAVDYLEKQIKKNIPSIKQLINEIVIEKNSSYFSRAKDGIISTQIETLLLSQEVFHPNHILFKTSRQTVYLMGAVTKREAEHATNLATRAKNVDKVVKLFNILLVRPAAEVERDNLKQAKEEEIAGLKEKRRQLELEQNEVIQQLDALIYD